MDFVARFNYFKIQKGAGAALGTKTDLWFLSEMKRPSAKEFNKAIRPRQYIVPVSIPARPVGLIRLVALKRAPTDARVPQSRIMLQPSHDSFSRFSLVNVCVVHPSSRVAPRRCRRDAASWPRRSASG